MDELFAIGEEARKKYRQFFARATADDWGEIVNLGFGDFKVSKRKMVAQALLHSVHHRAQLATFLRQHGLKQDWNHDFLMSKAME